MKKLSDKDIQKMLEEGHTFSGDEATDTDVRLYAQLFEALSTTPETALPADFADKVATVAYQRMLFRRQLRHYAILTGLSVLSLLTGVLCIAYVNLSFLTTLLQFVWQYKWVALSMLTFLSLVQLGDVWIKKQLQY